MKLVIAGAGAGALLLAGSAFAQMAPMGSPELQRALVEAGMQIALTHPVSDDWTGVGGPEDPGDMTMPASAMATTAVLVPKDETLPRMETGRSHAPDPGDKDAAPARADKDRQERKRHGRTAEAMRSGSAWAQYGGMSSGWDGVGGPEEDEALRVYPPCRSRSDDRCQQGR